MKAYFPYTIQIDTVTIRTTPPEFDDQIPETRIIPKFKVESFNVIKVSDSSIRIEFFPSDCSHSFKEPYVLNKNVIFF